MRLTKKSSPELDGIPIIYHRTGIVSSVFMLICELNPETKYEVNHPIHNNGYN